jgi:hypothetical protein
MPSSLFFTGPISRNERNDLSLRSPRVSFVHKKTGLKSALPAPASSAFPIIWVCIQKLLLSGKSK